MNREAIDRAFLRAVRFYTYNSPISRGKHRISSTALKLCNSLNDNFQAETKDGRKFSVNLKSGVFSSLYFLGEYERSVTQIITPLVREGDVCLDVGANFGWYSTLFQRHVGTTGEVHSFEPVLSTYEELSNNISLMKSSSNVFVNNLALSDESGEVTMNLFEGLSPGHASLSAHERDDAVSFKCRAVTLDSYLNENKVREVNFVKVDIEGAELMFLKGAENLFKQAVPPIWLMEMALNQSKNFGYYPDDLISFMRERADYDFYKVDEARTKIIKIDGFEKHDIGANVICFPRGSYADRFASLQNYL